MGRSQQTACGANIEYEAWGSTNVLPGVAPCHLPDGSVANRMGGCESRHRDILFQCLTYLSHRLVGQLGTAMTFAVYVSSLGNLIGNIVVVRANEKVGGGDTAGGIAVMADLLPVWDRAASQLIDIAMSIYHLAVTASKPAVSIPIGGSSPKPTWAGLVNMRPEAGHIGYGTRTV